METFALIQVLLGILVFFTSVIRSAIRKMRRKYNYWKERGVPGPKPLLLAGNFRELFAFRETEAEVLDKICDQFKDEKIIGLYYLWMPIICVKDLELIKKVTETDFDHFSDHPDIRSEEKADAITNSLFSMRGKVWKERRSWFSKLFTPKRIREYFKEMDPGLEVLVSDVDSLARRNEDVELIHLLERYTVHSIASTMYGIDLTKDDSTTSSLAKYAKIIIYPTKTTIAKLILHITLPSLYYFFKVAIQPIEIWNFVSEFARRTFESRNHFNADRNDLTNSLINLMNGNTLTREHITFDEAVGHFYSFFQAGHHTTEITFSHVLYYLAHNPRVQEKAIKEVDSVLKECTEVNYETMEKLPYLDNIIQETLRIIPSLGVMKRVCTKKYKVTENCEIPENMMIYIPISYLHANPQYFPDPEVFKPERFSTGEYEPSALMPFGKGPRICIGKKMAELEMKKALAAILAKYEVLPSDRMRLPIKYDPRTLFFTNIPLGGIWVKFKLR